MSKNISVFSHNYINIVLMSAFFNKSSHKTNFSRHTFIPQFNLNDTLNYSSNNSVCHSGASV